MPCVNLPAIVKIFLNAFIISPSICVFGMPSVLQQQIYNCALSVTSCMRRASGSVRGEVRPSRVFPGHVHSPTYVHGLLIPGSV